MTTERQKYNMWVSKANEMREQIRKQTNTMTKANELMNWYKEVTGEKCAHIEDAISHKAKIEANKYMASI